MASSGPPRIGTCAPAHLGTGTRAHRAPAHGRTGHRHTGARARPWPCARGAKTKTARLMLPPRAAIRQAGSSSAASPQTPLSLIGTRRSEAPSTAPKLCGFRAKPRHRSGSPPITVRGELAAGCARAKTNSAASPPGSGRAVHLVFPSVRSGVLPHSPQSAVDRGLGLASRLILSRCSFFPPEEQARSGCCGTRCSPL